MTRDLLTRRFDLSSEPSLQLTQGQQGLDAALNSFSQTAADPASLAAMTVGSFAFRFARLGFLQGAASSGITRFAPRFLLNGAVNLSALTVEVSAFRGANNLFGSWAGHHPEQGVFDVNGWRGTFVDFLALKTIGHLGAGQNIALTHFAQANAMVLGHEASARLGFTAHEQGSYIERLAHAEFTNMAMGAGMSLAGVLTGGATHRMERSIDLRIEALSHRSSNIAALENALGARSPQITAMAREGAWLRLGEGDRSVSIRVPERYLPEAENLSRGLTANSDLEAMSGFLRRVRNSKTGERLSAEGRREILEEVIHQFEARFVGSNDIHAITRDLSSQRSELIADYLNARQELGLVAQGSRSALLEAAARGEAGFSPIFGGQANAWLKEARNIYQTYPQTRDFMRRIAEVLQRDVASLGVEEAKLFNHGMDLMAWIEGKEPDAAYLSSSQVSQALILVTQLSHYYQALKSLGVEPGELLRHHKGTTGHSQGIMASVVVASSRTEQQFIENSINAARYLLWQGIRMAQAFPARALDQRVIDESVANQDGVPTAMAGILKLTPETVQRYVDRVNRTLAQDRKIEISLINGPQAVVVSAHPESLHELRKVLRADEAKGGQSRIPFSERKLELTWNYFPVGAPFHTKLYMARVPELLAADMQRLGIRFSAEDLQIPVFSTFDGSDLRSSSNLMEALIAMQSVQAVDWRKATAQLDREHGTSHILGFGPGEDVGVEYFTARNAEGRGTHVVAMGSLTKPKGTLDKSYLFDSNPESVSFAADWEREHAPRLVRDLNGNLMIDTKFTRLVGKPPVMQAGMTPTSANTEFTAGVIKGGFHAELAGGGQHTEAYFRARVSEIKEQIAPGDGVTVNLLFLNAYLWGFQYPLVEVMLREGEPIDGITIAAGVPSVEKATEVIRRLREAGIQHISFKPGSVDAIKQVVEIAKANPEANIILQWTGGRAGGHHSFEDMHDPILRTYASIRSQKNIVLVGGSGLGDAKDSLPYMTGEWSKPFGYAAMPFDGVLLASRLMVAQEARTATPVKEAIVEASGVANQAEWERTYKGPAGGILTASSELGEPIHYLANQAALFWREMDDRYFSIREKEKDAKKATAQLRDALARDRDEIIRGLNTRSHRFYFGIEKEGRIVDAPEMTYAEVARRMMELMYVQGETGGRWVDVTYRDRVFDFLVRAEERFHPRGKDRVAMMQKPADLERDPQAFLGRFLERYAQAASRRLSTEDVSYFYDLCRRPGKPVNFVPVLDENFEAWFKKDALGYSEELETAPDQNPERVIVLQGPVAVRYSTRANEPVSEIMGGVNQGFIEALQAKQGGDANIPTVEYLGGPEVRRIRESDLKGVKLDRSVDGRTLELSVPEAARELPSNTVWAQLIGGETASWSRALLTSNRLVQGKNKVENPIPNLLQPRAGRRIVVERTEAGDVTAIKVFDPSMQVMGPAETSPSLVITREGQKIQVSLHHPRSASLRGPARIVSLNLEYEYHPEQGYAPIHDVTPELNQRIKDFYAQLWFDRSDVGELDLDSTFQSDRPFVFTREHIRQFTEAILAGHEGNRNPVYLDQGQAPLDMAIVGFWEPIIKPVLVRQLEGNIFNLVHLYNKFSTMGDRDPLMEADVAMGSGKIRSVRILQAGEKVTLDNGVEVSGPGKIIEVEGELTREGKSPIQIRSGFFIRGTFQDYGNTFNRSSERYLLPVLRGEEVAVLRSRPWLQLNEGVQIEAGDRLTVQVETIDRPANSKSLATTETRGFLYRNGQVIGRIEHSATQVAGNTVSAYLAEHAKLERAPEVALENGGYNLLREVDQVTAPTDNRVYGRASYDLNPIHDNIMMADYAHLPDTIVHGMWTSANGRRVVEQKVCHNNGRRIVEYEAQFTGMVRRGDRLFTQVRHVGMRDGMMALEVTTVNQSGDVVLKAKALVDQVPTFYSFTGQGDASPIQKVVPALYESSEVARRIWDRADAHIQQKFGFSLLAIARGNPKELTVSFGGEAGRRIRENYMRLKVRERNEDGSWTEKRVFPEINEQTDSYTFRHPQGLNFATQFTQPIVLIHEKASFEDLRANGGVAREAMFGGHSLGEYGALAAVLGESYDRYLDTKQSTPGSLSLEAIAEITFMRGITMQMSVPRDAQGRSPFGMAVVKPHKVARGFAQEQLIGLCSAFEAAGAQLLEVVNNNIRGKQYSVVGDRQSLVALNFALTKLQKNPRRGSPEELTGLIQESLAEARAEIAKISDGFIEVSSVRNEWFIGLTVDVPFHSKALRRGVDAFRDVLNERFGQDVEVEKLEGRYIPNLNGKPFSLERSYIQELFDQTQSPVLGEILGDWETRSQDRTALGRALLIELLAYQFASNVKWVETQEHIFGEGVERFVEFGHQGTTDGMAAQTLAASRYPRGVGETVLFYGARDKVYYNLADEAPSAQDAAKAWQAKNAPAAEAPKAEAAPTPTPAPVPTQAPAPVPVAAPPASAGGAPVADAPVTALESIKVLLALQFSRNPAEISDSESIKGLAGGKSAAVNEVLGKLGEEFGASDDRSVSEKPLSELAAQLGASYRGLGKNTSAQVNTLLGSKMPAGFGMAQVKAYLSAERQLGEGRIQGVLLHALTMAPTARLGNEGEAKAFLDRVVDSYGQKIGQAIPKGRAAAPVAATGPVVSAGPVAQPVADAPLRALDTLRVMLAMQFGRKASEIADTDTIKGLAGGKSAAVNEVLGKLGEEFGASDDRSVSEKPLSELAAQLGATYKAPGKFSSAQVNALLGSKMPAGFGMAQIRAHLSSERLLGEGRIQGVLIQALSMAPAARLGSEAEAKAWLDSVVDTYAQAQGINIPRASQAGGAVAGPVAGADPAAVAEIRHQQEALIRDMMRAYADFLGEDPRAGELMAQMEQKLRADLEGQVSTWNAEFGEKFREGIEPLFSSQKYRQYNAAWNWARQDAISLYYELSTGRLPLDHPSMIQRNYHLVNRATPQLLEVVRFYSEKAREEGHRNIARHFETLARQIEARVKGNVAPVTRMVEASTRPEVQILDDGAVRTREVPREGIESAEDYVREMRTGGEFNTHPVAAAARSILESAVRTSRRLIRELRKILSSAERSEQIEIQAQIDEENARLGDMEARLNGKRHSPFLFLQRRSASDPNNRIPSAELSSKFYQSMESMARDGLSLRGKTYLVTGAGPRSIGSEMVKDLLRAGAKVIVTTSSFGKDRTAYYQSLYENYGAEGSELVVLPFNQGSVQDVKSLVNHIYSEKGLNTDIDGIIPFAGIEVEGRDIGNIDARAELANRIMLVNTIRLIGEVKNQKQQRGITTRPAHVVLPLSPNHGNFGHDGLYGEIKIGLEAMMNKWRAEGWSSYLSMAGAVIGWTRGTNLMKGNDAVSVSAERAGSRTFSQREQAWNLLTLLHPEMVREAQTEPVWADFNGGAQFIDFSQISQQARTELQSESANRRAVSEADRRDQEVIGTRRSKPREVNPRANFDLGVPAIPSRERLEALKHLRGMVDLSKVVVVTGFGEVGPWGNARTRWEMESQGEFSLEGSIEMAWMMGLIKRHNGPLGEVRQYSGWVDAQTNEAVADHEVKERYEKRILEHTGIRLVEPELFEGYDPHKKFFLREVVLTRDFTPFEVGSREDADSFVRQHGDKVQVFEGGDGQWTVQLKAGAVLRIPRALQFDRFVAGQVPTGWDPRRYGVPEDIVKQVDPTTLYTLVSTVEALVSSGITDPYEFYEYVHVSEVGNTTGGGMGGMRSIRRSFYERRLEAGIQADILQEQLINVMPAWINMLLLSSSGPIKVPVGACATAAHSVELGVDTIQTGKAKVVLVGGYDDFGEEGAYEFAQMKATSNSQGQLAQGRDPREHSRPSTSSRSGFMEAQGAGVQVLMSADLALAMGTPIYGIVALTNTATDKQGRSVPAPGQGILTTAREVQGAWRTNPMLDVAYRRKQLEREMKAVERWERTELGRVNREAQRMASRTGQEVAVLELSLKQSIERQTHARRQQVWATYGQDFWRNDPTISPLRGALAAWGLTPDDVEISSFHGTSTDANDRNESGVNQQQMVHLQRSKGNPLLTIWQKWLTGHPKGAAAAWMFNGVIQAMISGIAPGNRNGDNTDPAFQGFDQLVYNNKSIHFGRGLKAGLLKSFGFGQAGGEILVIHPDYLFGALEDGAIDQYQQRRDRRMERALNHHEDAVYGRGAYVRVKDAPPYTPQDEAAVYLNPLARARFSPKLGTWSFSGAQVNSSDSVPNANSASSGSADRYGRTPQLSDSAHLEAALRRQALATRGVGILGTGTDAENLNDWPGRVADESFIRRNFTEEEIARSRDSANPVASFAGRWTAKEAVIKAISSARPDAERLWRDSGASLSDIEIIPGSSGAPQVVLRGHAARVAQSMGIREISVSITHTDTMATAVVQVR